MAVNFLYGRSPVETIHSPAIEFNGIGESANSTYNSNINQPISFYYEDDTPYEYQQNNYKNGKNSKYTNTNNNNKNVKCENNNNSLIGLTEYNQRG